MNEEVNGNRKQFWKEEIVSDKDIDEMQRDCPVVQKFKKCM